MREMATGVGSGWRKRKKYSSNCLFFDHLASLKVALGGMPGKYMATSDHP